MSFATFFFQGKSTYLKCTTSGKTLANLTCAIKMYDRISSHLNFAADIIREIDKFYVRIRLD